MRLKLSLFRLSPMADVHGPLSVGCCLRLVWIQTICGRARFAARVSVELPMRHARRSKARDRLPRVRAPEDRMDRPHSQEQHIHCVETHDALFVYSATF